MVGFMGMGVRGNKMLKRKEADLDLDELNHDFSDFSLSSPARKIRRLDAELPPIMEEEDECSEISCSSSSPAFMEELELDSVNDKAIVLFKRLNSPFLNSTSPCNLSVSVDSDLICGFKDQFIRATTQQKGTASEEDIAVSSSRQEESLAVVPWVSPSLLVPPPTVSGVEISQTTKPCELTMEAEDIMDIEDTNENILQLGQSGDGFGGIGGVRSAGEGLPQWQQQHCMVPQPPQYTSTPINWLQRDSLN